MAWSARGVARQNLSASGVVTTSGDVGSLSACLLESGEPVNFIISGCGDPGDRYLPLVPYLSTVMGRWPLVVLHARDEVMEGLLASVCQAGHTEVPLWGVNQGNRFFEPFYGMNDMQVIGVVRTLAERLGYTSTPRLERVVRSHLEILRLLDVPTSLSGLHYLCSFRDMGEFHSNILQLPCSQDHAIRLWADLGVDAGDDGAQFDLFRSAIENLANEASYCGWEESTTVGAWNTREAIASRVTFCLALDNEHSSLMLAYLAEELRNASAPYILLLDGITIGDKSFQNLLLSPTSYMRFGVIADNVVDLMAGDGDCFNRLMERASTLVLFKHNTATAATALAEVIGRFDAVRVSESTGSSRGFFNVLPRDQHRDVSITTESRYRVMPEEITALAPGSAIVFDSKRDEILFHN